MNRPEPSARRRWLAAGTVALGAAAAGAWWRLRTEPAQPSAVQAFWQQAFEQPEGPPVSLAAWRGRPLLVNFWATWCPPCVEELPMLDAFWREHASKGIQMLALAIDQPSAVRRFLARQPLAFPVGLAGLNGSQWARDLGNSQGGLPFTVIFAKNGDISRQKLGQLTPQDLTAWRQQWA